MIDKIQKLLAIREILVQKNVTSHESKVSKVDVCDLLKETNASFRNLDRSTLLKWVNISLGFISEDMRTSWDLFVSLSERGRGNGLVWEVMERAQFISLGNLAKILVMRAMSAKHVYRIDLAHRLRQGPENESRKGKRDRSDPVPPDAGEGDEVTRWSGSECKQLIEHGGMIADCLLKMVSENNIPATLLTDGEFTINETTTTTGLSGVFATLYRDIPGPKSKRSPKYPTAEHLGIMKKLIEDGSFPTPVRESNADKELGLTSHNDDGSANIATNEDVESEGTRTNEVVSSDEEIRVPRKRAKKGPSSKELSKSKNKKSAAPENEAPVSKQKLNNRKTKKTTKSTEQSRRGGKSRREVASELQNVEANDNEAEEIQPNPAPLPRNRVPKKSPRAPPPRITVPSSDHFDANQKDATNEKECSRGREDTPPNSDGSNVEILEEEIVIASGRACPRNLVENEPTVPINVRNTQDGTNAREGGAFLVDLNSDDEASNEHEIENDNDMEDNINGTKTILGDVFEEHEEAIETMIEQDKHGCIPKKISRVEETIDREDLQSEIFPAAISIDSFARKMSLRLVKEIREFLDVYVTAMLKKEYGKEMTDFMGVEPRFEKETKSQFFQMKRNLLEMGGLCIFENVLLSENDEDVIGVDKVFQYVEDNFRTGPVEANKRKELQREKDVTKLWVPIFNVGQADMERNTPPNERRFQTWPWKIEKGLPNSISKKKAAIDILLGFILQKMYPVNEFRDPRVRHFSFSNYSSIFLRTCEDTPRQVAHTDFPPVEPEGKFPYHAPAPLHDVFMMYSGKQAFAIRIWNTSHVEMNVDTSKPEQLKDIARNMRSKLQIVPPYSVMIGRGDVVHCGSSGYEMKRAFRDYKGSTDDEKKKGKHIFIQCGDHKYNTRGHLYATRGKYTFDGVFRSPPEFPTRVLDDNL